MRALPRGNDGGMTPPAPIFRAPMRARDRDLPPGTGADHGIAQGLVGLGGRLDPVPRSLQAAASATEAGQGVKAARMLTRFAALEDGTFVWTRTSDGLYRLGRLAGPWRYDDSSAARAVGIHHVRSVEWLPHALAADETPVAVIATFHRGGRNFQRTHDRLAERQTRELWDAAQSEAKARNAAVISASGPSSG